MARNRVTYQSEALFVSDHAAAPSTADTTKEQLRRVQSANYSFSIGRTDVNQFGQVGRIDSLITEAPTVSLDYSYLLSEGANEDLLGFSVNRTNNTAALELITLTSTLDQFTKGIFDGANNRQGVNYYISTAPDGKDINENDGSEQSVISIGNAVITEYSFEASVGALPTVSVSAEGANIQVTPTGEKVIAPSLDVNGALIDDAAEVGEVGKAGEFTAAEQLGAASNEVTALRPSDMVILFAAEDAAHPNGKSAASVLTSLPQDSADAAASDEGFAGVTTLIENENAAHLQSFSFSLPLSRTPLQKIGSWANYARPIDTPANATLSVSAIVNEMNKGALNDALCNDVQDVIVVMRKPGCPGDTNKSAIAMVWMFKDILLESESMSSSIGDNKTVDLTYNVAVQGDSVTEKGIFLATNGDHA
jgi:hypothetical protein